MATNFCWLIHRAELLSFGDIDIGQMAVTYERSCVCASLGAG